MSEPREVSKSNFNNLKANSNSSFKPHSKKKKLLMKSEEMSKQTFSISDVASIYKRRAIRQPICW